MCHAHDDAEAIRNLLGRYADLVDAADVEALGELFTPDATALLLGAELSGREEILAYVARALDACAATSHLIGSHAISSRWDRATQTAVVQAFHVFADTGETWLLHGRYVQDLVRTDVGWRIARHELHGVGAEGTGPARTYTGHPRRLVPAA